MHVLTLPLITSEDILAVRAASRAIATQLGLDEADQVRLATALSEVGREVLLDSRDGDVAFGAVGPPNAAITVAFTARGVDEHRDLDRAGGIQAARRLVDAVEVRAERSERVVELMRRLAYSARPDVAVLVAAIRAAVPPTPLEELWNQNRQLATTLDELLAKQEETLRLNVELEETNSGVMAMYAQLSEELEDTNRGVVALYAELDDKSIQLQEAGQAKSRFFAAVSHELRSPVNSIIGLARVMREEDAEPLTDEQRHQIGLVERAASDLSQLVNQLLDISKAEAGRLEPETNAVDVRVLAAQLRGSLRPLVDESRVALVLDIADDVPIIETDETLLGQILRNLLVNAVKYTAAGEVRLAITVDDNAQRIRCAISDTGIGIEAENLDRIFEEFFQVRGPMQTRTRGTGLGLAHSRRLAQVLGADLTVESEVGRGSTFALAVPVHWNDAMVGNASPPQVAVPKREVLVVDDDEVFRTALRGMLQGLADRVTEAPHAAAAFDLMTETRPDVVFLDLRMPDADGEEVLAWMGGQPELRDVPVVIVTSVDLGIEIRARLGRAHALLAKAEITRERVAAVLADLDEEDFT